MPIFSADNWFLSSLTDIFLEDGVLHFFLASAGTDLVINFDLVKYITKMNINSCQNHTEKVEGGHSPQR